MRKSKHLVTGGGVCVWKQRRRRKRHTQRPDKGLAINGCLQSAWLPAPEPPVTAGQPDKCLTLSKGPRQQPTAHLRLCAWTHTRQPLLTAPSAGFKLGFRPGQSREAAAARRAGGTQTRLRPVDVNVSRGQQAAARSSIQPLISPRVAEEMASSHNQTCFRNKAPV